MGCGPSSEADSKPTKNSLTSTTTTTTTTARQRNVEEIERIELTEGVVQEYVRLEKDIYKLEKKNVLKKYEAKMLYADEFKKTVDQLEATYKELKKQTEKEKADVDNIEQPSVRAFLKQQGTWEQKFNKEQQEYLDALNRQEVAEKELKGAKLQYERAAKIAEIYKKRCDRQNELYEKQDRLLAGIFGGQYASDLENQLEGQLDDGLEWQQRVNLAKFKWTNGRVLLVHACTQMAFGITRWKELESIEARQNGKGALSFLQYLRTELNLRSHRFYLKTFSNTRMRYFAAAEARNNFIAAGQNVQSCRVYLGKVQFPYCTEEEMANLESTVNSAFNDIQTNATLKKALNVYKFTHKKVAALIQWFDQVINETILKDLDKANTDVSKVQKALREERLRLMKQKVREKLGRDVNIKYDDIDDDDETDEELLALEADRVNDQNDLPGKTLTSLLNLSQPDGRQPTPLPTQELAPIPSKEALFGDVAKKINEYEDSKKTLEKRDAVQREKQGMALQEKLRLRQQKNRRSRKERRESINPTAGLNMAK